MLFMIHHCWSIDAQCYRCDGQPNDWRTDSAGGVSSYSGYWSRPIIKVNWIHHLFREHSDVTYTGSPHSGLNQGVRLSYDNFQISPRTPYARFQQIVLVKILWLWVLTIYYVPLCVWYLMFELSVFLFLWHCCTRTISARAAQ